MGFEVTAPDDDAEQELTIWLDQRYTDAYIDAARQANADLRQDYIAAGRNPPAEDAFPESMRLTADGDPTDPDSMFFNPESLAEQGFEITDQDHQGFRASRSLPLAEALANQEQSGDTVITVDDSQAPLIRYIFQRPFDIEDEDGDLVEGLEALEQLRQDGLPPKESLDLVDVETGPEPEDVDWIALLANASEITSQEGYYALRIILEAGWPIMRTVVSLPGQVVECTVDGKPTGVIQGGTATISVDETFIKTFGPGTHTIRVVNEYHPDQAVDDRERDQRATPEAGIALACQPMEPEEGESVDCTVSVRGHDASEQRTFHWYLDDASVATTDAPGWTWASAEPGTHDIGVQVVGEGWSEDATVTIVVDADQELVATIGMFPDPPVPDKLLQFTVAVEGRRKGEYLSYIWFIDDMGQSESPAFAALALTGTHSVQVEVRGDGPDRLAVDRRNFTVPPLDMAGGDAGAEGAQGFRITFFEFDQALTSDETLSARVGFERDDESIGVLQVLWFVDGALAHSESTVGQRSSFSLRRPPPGDHRIEVRVVHPETGAGDARAGLVQVAEGSGSPISPQDAATSATGTGVAIGTWLWAEHWRRKQLERAESLRRAQEEAADAALEQDRNRWYDRIMELNDVEKARRQVAERLSRGPHPLQGEIDKLGQETQQLVRDFHTLTKQLQRKRAEWNAMRWTAVTDGMIETADVCLEVWLLMQGYGPQHFANGAGFSAGKDWLKGLFKAAAEQKFREAFGAPKDPHAMGKVNLNTIGMPSDYVYGRGTDGKTPGEVVYDFVPRGLGKTAFQKNLEKIGHDQAAKGYGPAETAVTATTDAYKKAQDVEQLGKDIIELQRRMRSRQERIDDGLHDIARKRQQLADIQRRQDSTPLPDTRPGYDTEAAWQSSTRR